VPPFLLRADGADERLGCGGPVLGLIEDASYEAGEAVLAAGDLVAMVTDGVTEALSPDDQEFADERTLETLRRSLAGPASQTVAALVDGVGAWTGAAGCSDDLTVMVLKARPA
jgi:sigma-B regulation protein RsbU (phosphoserine phosphatase)